MESYRGYWCVGLKTELHWQISVNGVSRRCEKSLRDCSIISGCHKGLWNWHVEKFKKVKQDSRKGNLLKKYATVFRCKNPDGLRNKKVIRRKMDIEYGWRHPIGHCINCRQLGLGAAEYFDISERKGRLVETKHHVMLRCSLWNMRRAVNFYGLHCLELDYKN